MHMWHGTDEHVLTEYLPFSNSDFDFLCVLLLHVDVSVDMPESFSDYGH